MTAQSFEIRWMMLEEALLVSALVTRVFDAHTGQLYTAEGCVEFHQFSAHPEIRKRFSINHATWVAIKAGIIVGMVEVRPPNHVSLLFVDTQQQRQGIGKALFMQAVTWITQQYPDTQYISVNASPNAKAAYARWGFRATHPEQEHNGIRYIPMLYCIDSIPETFCDSEIDAHSC